MGPDKDAAHLAGKLQRRMLKFGSTRTPLELDFDGKRMIVAGSEVYQIPVEWSFTEFLLSYGLGRIGRALVNNEADLNNPAHPLSSLLLASQGYSEEPGDKLIAANDKLQSFIHFSWDLFSVADNAHVQKALLDRLSKPDLFQGARYELFVAASLLRGGFSIEFEDETDVTRKHCEFTATYRKTGRKYSVEAKSRHRPRPDYERADIYRLIQKALAKAADCERIIFIDVNMPHDTGALMESPWHSEIGETLAELERRQSIVRPWPQAILLLTNGTFSPGVVANGRISTTIMTAINHPLFKQQSDAAIRSTYPELGELFNATDRLSDPPSDFLLQEAELLAK